MANFPKLQKFQPNITEIMDDYFKCDQHDQKCLNAVYEKTMKLKTDVPEVSAFVVHYFFCIFSSVSFCMSLSHNFITSKKNSLFKVQGLLSKICYRKC